jgi:hypothetical protein
MSGEGQEVRPVGPGVIVVLVPLPGLPDLPTMNPAISRATTTTTHHGRWAVAMYPTTATNARSAVISLIPLNFSTPLPRAHRGPPASQQAYDATIRETVV